MAGDDPVIPFVPPLPAHLPPVAVDGVVPPPARPLAPEEVEHYRWLIDGILHGTERLIARGLNETAAVAIDASRDLFAELIARIHEGEETR